MREAQREKSEAETAKRETEAKIEHEKREAETKIEREKREVEAKLEREKLKLERIEAKKHEAEKGAREADIRTYRTGWSFFFHLK